MIRADDWGAARQGTIQVARWSAGTCMKCADPLIQGEELVRVKYGWIHTDCWRKHPRRQ